MILLSRLSREVQVQCFVFQELMDLLLLRQARVLLRAAQVSHLSIGASLADYFDRCRELTRFFSILHREITERNARECSHPPVQIHGFHPKFGIIIAHLLQVLSA